MKTRSFQQVDVFSATPYRGNALAVVLDGTGLDDAQMQAFARWTQLSETAFLLPPSAPQAHYRLRIFTPAYELPFAGHPTLGSCHAWLSGPGQSHSAEEVVQECGIGLVRIRRAGDRLAFAAPKLQRSAPSEELLGAVALAMGLQRSAIRAAQLLNNGPTWLGLLLDSQDTVLGLQPQLPKLAGLVPDVGVASVEHWQDAPELIARSNREARAFAQATNSVNPSTDASTAEPSVEVRCFSHDLGVSEDPVTGSFNASLAQWLIADGLAPSTYIAAQGQCIGRAGRIYIEQDADGQVWVGGDSVSYITGTVVL